MQKPKLNFIWYEKYRPINLKQMALPDDVRDSFQDFITKQDIPHLLLYGSPGSGKTTITKVLLDNIRCSVLSLNASSADRGIETVKTKVKTFAQSKQLTGYLKVVFLDEADKMTPDAQDALRNTIETYAKHCRFVLTANKFEKIDPAIKSRCRLFHFNQYPKKELLKLLKVITRKEIIRVPDSSLRKIIDTFYPDIRTILNELQNACSGGKFSLSKIKALSLDLKTFSKNILKGNVHNLRNILINLTDMDFLYRWLYDEFLKDNGSDEQKTEIVLAIAEYQNAGSYTPDIEINMVACLVSIMQILGITPQF